MGNTCILDLYSELLVAELQGACDALQVIDEHARTEVHNSEDLVSRPHHCSATGCKKQPQARSGLCINPSMRAQGGIAFLFHMLQQPH